MHLAAVLPALELLEEALAQTCFRVQQRMRAKLARASLHDDAAASDLFVDRIEPLRLASNLVEQSPLPGTELPCCERSQLPPELSGCFTHSTGRGAKASTD